MLMLLAIKTSVDPSGWLYYLTSSGYSNYQGYSAVDALLGSVPTVLTGICSLSLSCGYATYAAASAVQTEGAILVTSVVHVAAQTTT